MTKEAFFKLTDKYTQGTALPEEKRAIETFCERVQISEVSETWNLSQQEEIRVRLLKNTTQSIDAYERDQSYKIKRNTSLFWKVAVAVSLLVSVGWFFLETQLNEPSIVYLTKATQRGQRATITLSDGSTVQLNAESSIHFPETFASLDTREIILTGEAFFKVKNHKKKPFIVKTGDMHTTVLGTSFNINAYPENKDITVSVVSGRVKAGHADAVRELTPGEQAVFIKETHSISTSKVALEPYVAWKEGTILLDRVSMEKAAEIFGRWYNVTFVFGDPAIMACEISGKFKSDKLSNILENLNFLIGITYRVTADNKIILTKTPAE